MKNVKRIALILLAMIAVFVLSICFGMLNCCLYHTSRSCLGADIAALRSVIAEAYIRTKSDSAFVNTATDNQPMELPEIYYTPVESAQGHGRVHVIVYADGEVSAYFGTPERTLKYYQYGEGYLRLHQFPCRRFFQNFPVLCGAAVLPVGMAVSCIVRRVKKKNFEATIAALQADELA